MAHPARMALGALALMLAPLPASAQDAEAQVMATVEAFMDGLEAKDGEAMRALAMEDAYLALVRPSQGDAPDRTQSARLDEVVTSLTDIPGEIAEPLGEATVLVDGPIAMVWAPFAFYMDGARTHCGIDVFTLMQVDGAWRISTVTYSHLNEGCEDAPTP